VPINESCANVTAMRTLSHLFDNNRAWARDVSARDPDFFPSLARQQAPHYLWIGCSDSRVPANEIIKLAPGELFVHRNVANVVVHTDLNCLSVLQYAVEVLKVEDVIVVGHYGCGGVRAAYTQASYGLIDNWLRHVQDVRERHRAVFELPGTEREQVDRLCELNVIDQVRNVCQTTIVKGAWQGGQALSVHGWIYDVADGLLRDLDCTVSSDEETAAACASAVAQVSARARQHA
jgi:carbonic anhydrase